MKITYKNLKNYLPNQATNNAKPILYAINNSYCDYVQLFTFDNIKAVAKWLNVYIVMIKNINTYLYTNYKTNIICY